MRVKLEWKPNDLWIGAYWESRTNYGIRYTHVWICLVPMLPIHISWFYDHRRDT